MSKPARAAVCAGILLTGVLAAAQGPAPMSVSVLTPNGFPLKANLPGVIGRSDIVLARPNLDSQQALPLGNGRLGAAVWSADGMTIQLNRADTLPYRYSTGQIVIPGLSALNSAKDYAGRLNLYNGAVEERGGGMTATVYIQPDTDTLIVDVTGADPAKFQTAVLRLWEPRKPSTMVRGKLGLLAESWVDNQDPGASGRRFGSLSAIAGAGASVSAMQTDARTITLTIKPDATGKFRVIVASPHYEGDSASAIAQTLAAKGLVGIDSKKHLEWWHEFWQHADLMKVSSADGAGEYMENLRAIYLFSAAAENGGEYPGSQAGVGDLFSAAGDKHQWDSAAFWHWNLRMQIAANLSAGLAALNAPYFRLYRENLASIEKWTKEHMGGAPGICVPETMRFNGPGIEYEDWAPRPHPVSGWNCDLASKPYYNARTISTGAEVSLWIWQQYLTTGDRKFLEANYPVMVDAALFLLAYEKPGADGLLHTSPSNAHETQWDTTDPITDVSARKALYAALVEAAKVLGKDAELVSRVKAAARKIPPLPRVLPGPPALLLGAGGDDGGKDLLANSYKPGDELHNVENLGLEPVWPYDLIGDTSSMFDLAKRTYLARPNRANIDWSFDPVQAARLGMGAEVSDALVKITEANQHYINGFAKWGGDGREFYVEQIADVALGLQEALVQDYDGVIRVAPAVPPGWDFDGSVAVRFGTTVHVQVRNGAPVAVGLDVTQSQTIRLRNPWPGEEIAVTDMAGAAVSKASREKEIEFAAKAGGRYRVHRTGGGDRDQFQPVDGTPATAYRKLGAVQIGLGPS